MAMIGDVLVKFVADFAEFTRAMAGGKTQLDDFAANVKKIEGQISGAINTFKGLAVVTAAVWAFDKIKAYGQAIEAATAEIAKAAATHKLTTDQVQALQAAAVQTGRSFDDLAETAKKNKQWLDELTTAFKDEKPFFGKEVMDQAIIDMGRADEAGRKLDEQMKSLQVTLAPFYYKTKAWALESIAEGISNITEAAKEASNYTGLFNQFMAFIAARAAESPQIKSGRTLLFGDENFSGGGPSRIQRDLNEMQRLVDKQAELQALIDKGGRTQPRGPRVLGTLPDEIKQTQEAIDKLARSMSQFNEGQTGRPGFATRASQAPPSKSIEDEIAEWSRMGTAARAARGGGGGRSDEDSLQAQIDRYKALDEAAKRAYQTIITNQNKGVEELQREVAVQQRIDEVVGKLGAKYHEASKEKKLEFRAAVEAALQDDELARKRLENIIAADELERKLGDGKRARERAARDEQRLREGGATEETLRRNAKATEEQLNQNAAAAKRYGSALEQLGGGFEVAMEQWAKANDLYAAGGKAFGAMMDSLGEAFDVLAGKSQKSFTEIARNFAEMLAKIAMQAAVSEVFKWILKGARLALAASGSVSGGSVAPAGTPATEPSVWGNDAVGGDVMAGRAYRVGEFGPETYVPAAAGRIEPWRAGSGGGGDVIVNLDMKKAEGARDPASALEFGRRVKAAVQDVIDNEKRPGGSLYSRATA